MYQPAEQLNFFLPQFFYDVAQIMHKMQGKAALRHAQMPYP